MEQIRCLKPEEIEIRVQQCSEKGFSCLLYKTARVDMAILDEIFGLNNWTTDYKEIKGNLYCGIGTRTNEKEEFVWKWDCGIESREDSDGNQKKGEASDAFKRAGVKVGIGRELYSAPFIWISSDLVPTEKGTNGKWQVKGYPDLCVSDIEYNSNKDITELTIKSKGKTVFTYPKRSLKEDMKDTRPVAQPTITKEQPTVTNISITEEFKKLIAIYGIATVSQTAKELGISSKTATIEDVEKLKSSLEKCGV